MREILFRAKRVDNGEWVEGYYIYHIKRTICPIGDSVKPEDEQHVIMQDGFSDWNMPRNTVVFNINPETLCQYTGLTDKNGRKIWENDIVHRAYHSEDDCIIVWHDGGFHFKTIHGQYNQDRMTLLRLCFTQKSVDRLGVIGNIFDNPELLKEDRHGEENTGRMLRK